ncbi:MAG: flagellar basal body rod protein FlgC [Candidatus Hydrogenedentota bacterium]
MLDNISATDIAVGGIRAQHIRMNIIANNIANAETTRTPEGGPFRRQLAVFKGTSLGQQFNADRFGVMVSKILDDSSPFREVYNPGHPDANENGIVSYPNVNLSVEMINMLSAQRAYEANIDVITSSKRMGAKALEIIQA